MGNLDWFGLTAKDKDAFEQSLAHSEDGMKRINAAGEAVNLFQKYGIDATKLTSQDARGVVFRGIRNFDSKPWILRQITPGGVYSSVLEEAKRFREAKQKQLEAKKPSTEKR